MCLINIFINGDMIIGSYMNTMSHYKADRHTNVHYADTDKHINLSVPLGLALNYPLL